ncbi:MAG: extracellular solute-binding protein [Oscillospiraceae bacterium]|nr:extracellular solute-binding protein [Oscillospiraceae bacterium]
MRNSFGRLLVLPVIVSMVLTGSSCQNTRNPNGTGNDISTTSATGGSLEQTADGASFYSIREIDLYTPEGENESTDCHMFRIGEKIAIVTETITFPNPKSPESEEERKQTLHVFDFDGTRVTEADLSDLFDNKTRLVRVQEDGKENVVIFAETEDVATATFQMEYAVVDLSGRIIIPKTKLAAGAPGRDAAMDLRGNIYVSAYGISGMEISIYDAEGSLLTSVQEKEEGISLDLVTINGDVYVISYGASGCEPSYLRIDSQTGETGNPLVPGAENSAYIFYNEDFPEGIVCFEKGSGLSAYNIVTQETKPLLEWKNTDVEVSRYEDNRWQILSSDRLAMVSELSVLTRDKEPDRDSVKLVILTRQEAHPNEGKQVIILGGIGISGYRELLSEIDYYNRNSDRYRVEIRDYWEENTSEAGNHDERIAQQDASLAEAEKRLYLDFVGGNGPDLLCNSGDSSFLDRYEAQGMLADLYELAASDGGFHREDYVQSVLSLFERDGKLCQIPMGFSLSAWVGPTRLIGDRSGWTIDELDNTLRDLPEGVLPFANTSRSIILSDLVSSSLNTLINDSGKTISFDTPEFCRLLEFAKTYGTKEIDWDSVGEWENPEGFVDEYQLMQQGNLALTIEGIGSPFTIAELRYLFGEPITLVGNPSENRSGPVAYVRTVLAISKESSNQEAAWDLIRFLISEETQSSRSIYSWVPIHRGALEKRNEEILLKRSEKEYVDEDNYSVRMTREDIDLYMEMVDSISGLMGKDRQIISIVQEEAAAYFAGVKTADEVSLIIQDRVTTFITERG